MSRRRTSRATRKGQNNQTWGAVVFEQTVDDAPAIEVEIMTGADWSVGSGLERATLLRVRGWLSAVPSSPVATADGGLYLQVYLTDVDSPLGQPPDTALAYVEDSLWTGGTMFGPGHANAVEGLRAYQFSFDVKAMRRVTSDQSLRLIMVTTSARFMVVGGLARALVRRSG